MWAPSLRYFSGSRRKSTTSASSSFASSMPATSANVTCSVVGSYFFAFELPNENMLSLPDRLMIQIPEPEEQEGREPKPASSVCHHGVPGGRLRGDHDALLLQQRVERLRVGEVRHPGRELGRRPRVLVARRVADRVLQRPLDRGVLRGDRRDVAGLHLREEGRRVGNRRRAAARRRRRTGGRTSS